MSTQPHTGHFHPLPVIGHPDSFYVNQIATAEAAGDVHAREAAKVGRYLTLAADPTMPWEEKLRHFSHALRRHCVPPPGAVPEIEVFYQRLAELVRRHASQEAFRFLAHQTESQRLRGQSLPRDERQRQAVELRNRLFGDSETRPAWMTQEAWDRVNRLLGELT